LKIENCEQKGDAMKYKLKPGVESFEVVDGPFAGKKFLRGKVYEKIPREEKGKFEEVRDQKSEDRGQKKKTPEPLNPEPGTAAERSTIY